MVYSNLFTKLSSGKFNAMILIIKSIILFFALYWSIYVACYAAAKIAEFLKTGQKGTVMTLTDMIIVSLLWAVFYYL